MMTEMEDLSAEAQWTPSNEKSCQTEDLCYEATVPGPDQSSKTPVCSIEPGDPPLLQKPLETSKSGIQQIIECFRTGTTQLKHILLKEVDTIFECKLCRSLFRGLPNLITHKEFYCLPRISQQQEPTGNRNQSLAIKELLQSIYPQPEGQDYTMRLEPIEGNHNAVFQHLIKEDHDHNDDEDDNDVESPLNGDDFNHNRDRWKHPRIENEEELSEDSEHSAKHESDRAEDTGIQEDDEEHVHEEEDMIRTLEDGVTPEENQNPEDEEEEGSVEVLDEKTLNNGVNDVTISCCLCGKDFSSRRSIRRHCHKMHKRRLEELRKFTETRTVPISLLSVIKDRQKVQELPQSSPTSKSCPVCFKTFATKANVCRHFDEVHRGLRRDLITPEISTKPGQLEAATPPTQAPASPSPKTLPTSTLPQCSKYYNLSTCKCLLCKRSYSTQARLKRHMRFVHKILTSKNSLPDLPQSSPVKTEPVECPSPSPSPSPSPLPSNDLQQASHERLKRSRPEEVDEDGPLSRKPRLSVGFDFRQLFCKLCKRQFSSRQNLTKHIELHTDNGSDIFIKFYRCPLCSYESRRKRDVLRHITVVHKKNSVYLSKILPGLENRAVKKPAEAVLGRTEKHSHGKEVNGSKAINGSKVGYGSRIIRSPSSKKAEHSTPSPPPSPLEIKPDLSHFSPPLTRRQSFLPRNCISNASTSNGELQDDTEVRVTKTFSLHACDICGRAFAKKFYLESHKRSHRNAASSDSRTTGVNTRSKSLIGSF